MITKLFLAGETQVHRRGQEAALQVLRGRQEDDRHQRNQPGGEEDSEGEYYPLDIIDDVDDDDDDDNDDDDDDDNDDDNDDDVYEEDDDDVDDEDEDDDDDHDVDDDDHNDDDLISVERGRHFVLAEEDSGRILRGLPGEILASHWSVRPGT